MIISPTLAAQAGEGRQRLAAAASANSLFASLVSGPGQAKSQAEDTLSLCFQAQAALVRVGLTSSRALANTFALVHSIIQLLQPPSFLFFLTLNHLLGLPVGWKERLAKVLEAKGMPVELLVKFACHTDSESYWSRG